MPITPLLSSYCELGDRYTGAVQRWLRLTGGSSTIDGAAVSNHVTLQLITTSGHRSILTEGDRRASDLIGRTRLAI